MYGVRIPNRDSNYRSAYGVETYFEQPCDNCKWPSECMANDICYKEQKTLDRVIKKPKYTHEELVSAIDRAEETLIINAWEKNNDSTI